MEYTEKASSLSNSSKMRSDNYTMLHIPRRKLTEARNARGLTQTELAEELSTTQTNVSRWEAGSVYPSAYYRKKVCAFFGLAASELDLDPVIEGSQFDRQECISCLPLPDEDLVGREADLLHLRQLLTSKQAFVAVSGMPGVGKTALVAALAHDPRTRKQFPDGILWAGLGVKPHKTNFRFWGKQLGLTDVEMSDLRSPAEWGVALRNAIGAKRMLLVMDDAWKEDAALSFRVGGPNCAHIVTTRFPALASTLSHTVFLVQELGEEHSMLLLRKLAPEIIEHEPEKVHELVHIVGGLPLALRLLGNYLRKEGRNGQTRRIRAALERITDRSERFQLTKAYAPLEYHSLDTEVSVSLRSVLALSDQHLSPQARTAFYSMGALPEKPATFSEEAALAVADCTHEILDELVDAGLVELSSTERYRLHQVISDYTRLQLQAQSKEVQKETYKRLVDYATSYALLYPKDDELDLIARECYLYRRALDEADMWGYYERFVYLAAALATYLRRCMIFAAEVYLARAIELAQSMDKDEVYPYLIKIVHERILMRLHQGDSATAVALAQMGLERAQETGDTETSQIFLDLLNKEELRLASLPIAPDPCGGTPFKSTRPTSV